VLLLALVLALATPARGPAELPLEGVLVPGRSLGGVQLGDTQAAVRARWGADFRVCASCAEQTWYFDFGGQRPDPVGAAVVFRRGRVVGVFTLGAPLGWRTANGVRVGEDVRRATAVYDRLRWRSCIGYSALTMRDERVVTSIYASGDVVYGFALGLPSEPVCR
jgi:hypothetical protein